MWDDFFKTIFLLPSLRFQYTVVYYSRMKLDGPGGELLMNKRDRGLDLTHRKAREASRFLHTCRQ